MNFSSRKLTKSALITFGLIIVAGCSTMDAVKDKYYSKLVLFDTANCAQYEEDKVQYCEKHKAEEFERFKSWKSADCNSIQTGYERQNDIDRSACLRVTEKVEKDSAIIATKQYKIALEKYESRAKLLPAVLDGASAIDAKILADEIASAAKSMPLNPAQMIDIVTRARELEQQLRLKISKYEGDKNLSDFAAENDRRNKQIQDEKQQKIRSNIDHDPTGFSNCKKLKDQVDVIAKSYLEKSSDYSHATSKITKNEIEKEANLILYKRDKLDKEMRTLNCARFF